MAWVRSRVRVSGWLTCRCSRRAANRFRVVCRMPRTPLAAERDTLSRLHNMPIADIEQARVVQLLVNDLHATVGTSHDYLALNTRSDFGSSSMTPRATFSVLSTIRNKTSTMNSSTRCAAVPATCASIVISGRLVVVRAGRPARGAARRARNEQRCLTSRCT
jgi:hypothetical protein